MALSSALKNHICDFSLLTTILSCQNTGETQVWFHGSNNQQEKNGPGNYKSNVCSRSRKFLYLFSSSSVKSYFCTAPFIHAAKGTPPGKPLPGSPRGSPIFSEAQNYLTCSLPDSHGFFIFPYHQKGIFPDCRNLDLRRNSP